MSFIGDLIGDITGSNKAAKGAEKAAQTQAGSAQQAIEYQKQADAKSQALEQPYVDAGSKALQAQLDLLGLNGNGSQQTAINGLTASPLYTTGVQQGEQAILANASATGGLRGGNTQNSLANFRASLLNSVYQGQLGNIAQVTGLGQNAAAGVGNSIQNSAGTVGNLLQQQGAALAGGQIAAGNSSLNGFNNALKIAGAAAAF